MFGGLAVWVTLMRIVAADNTGLLAAAVIAGCWVTAVAVALLMRRDRRAQAAENAATGARAGVRTEFGRAQGVGKILAATALLPVLSLGPAVVAYVSITTALILMMGMAFMLVPATVIAVHTVPKVLRTRQLVVDATGVQVRGRRRTITIAWRDIDSWWVGVPPGVVDRFVGRQAVIAVPASHIGNPAAGDVRPLWSRKAGGWRIGDPQLTDGSVEEVTAAFERFAPRSRSFNLDGNTVRAGPVRHSTNPQTSDVEHQ